jgi:hypothetical protein
MTLQIRHMKLFYSGYDLKYAFFIVRMNMVFNPSPHQFHFKALPKPTCSKTSNYSATGESIGLAFKALPLKPIHDSRFGIILVSSTFSVILTL